MEPLYGGGALDSLLTTVATSLGVPGMPVPGAHSLVPAAAQRPARRAVVVLVDGLGYELLRTRSGHAPFLRSLLPSAARITAGFPSTTATSMATFGTGEAPGVHGMVGYEVLIPEADRLLNELSWEDGPVPEVWQPVETVFQRAESAGVAVTRVGPAYFDGSGLTRAALRGGRFAAAESLEARVDTTLAALRAAPHALVYLYWGDVDKVGHVHGCSSWEWGEEVASVDAALRRLVASVPPDTAVHVTADHGMVDVPHALRVDIAHDPTLAAGIRHLTAEFRAPHVYCEPGAVEDVHATWTAVLGERATVLRREEAVAAGWFGPVRPENLPRIGDLVVAMHDTFAVVDSRTARPELLALHGLHGSLTEAEMAVPWFVVPARIES
ncbi:conserved hypothetical protein [Nostocoides japonicum T1-X7]|uniref:Type I phosphodiesterase/nucleotide pyrophosphatase n=1 Tax=Nostocoides japonicum T1-X7 TaxID=1194083 RepID=A0A077LTV7_9MICO|nr:nucleotide pyrophosphatase/phosphodiesterase family protein [Tetrasphaera japonica]CCH77093.1 conserved hypothetical protein [Tetrasphaera japonica T1-X7]